MKNPRLNCSLFAGLLLALLPQVGHAQDDEESTDSEQEVLADEDATTGEPTADETDDEDPDSGVFIMDLEVVDGTIDMPEAEYILTPTVVEPGPFPAYTDLGRNPRAGDEGVPDQIDADTDASESEDEGEADTASETESESTEALDD